MTREKIRQAWRIASRKYYVRHCADPAFRERINLRQRENPEYREGHRKRASTYRKKHRDSILKRNRAYYKRALQRPEFRERERERGRKRWADPEYRERQRLRHLTPKHRERKNQQRREQYRADPEFRKREIERGRKLYGTATYRERHRRNRWKKIFGISLEQYNARLAEQGGSCAICRKPETSLTRSGGYIRPLSIDHDHLTKRIRGLLCHKCNSALGLLYEQPELLRQAIRYLGETP